MLEFVRPELVRPELGPPERGIPDHSARPAGWRRRTVEAIAAVVSGLLFAWYAAQVVAQPPSPSGAAAPTTRPPSRPATPESPLDAEALAVRQARLRRLFDDFRERLRELASQSAETAPDESERLAATLRKLGELNVEARMTEITRRLRSNDHAQAAELQRSVLGDLSRLQRFLRTGSDETSEPDDFASELADAIAAAHAAQKRINQSTSALLAGRSTEGTWKRAERLTLARLGTEQAEVGARFAPVTARLPESPTWQAVGTLLKQAHADQVAIARSLSVFDVDEPLLERQRAVEAMLADLLRTLRPRQASPEAVEEGEPPVDDPVDTTQDLSLSATLKLLRSTQRRLHEQTRAWDARHRESPVTAPDLDARMRELELLRSRQTELGQQLRALLESNPAP